MWKNKIDYISDATNVYRTKNFIVKQRIGIQYDEEENTVTFSHDTYYKRTIQRDAEYELLFGKRKRIDGKRLRTVMYARTYVE